MNQEYRKLTKVTVTRIASPGAHDSAVLRAGEDVVVDGFDPDTGAVHPAVRSGRLIELVVPSPGARAEGFVSGLGWFTITRLWPADGHHEAVREAELAADRAQADRSAGNSIADQVRKAAEQATEEIFGSRGDPLGIKRFVDSLEAIRKAKYQPGDSVPVDELPREETHPRRGAAEVADSGGWQVRLPFPLLSSVVMDGPPEIAGRTDRDSYAFGIVVGYSVGIGYSLLVRVEWWDACDLKAGTFEAERLQAKTW